MSNMNYPLYNSTIVSSEMDIKVFIEEKNKEISVQLNPSTLIRDVIDQIADFMVLPPEEKELRGLFLGDKLLNPDSTIEKNSIKSNNVVVFKKTIDPNAITINVEILGDAKQYQFVVNPFSGLAEIAQSISNLIGNPMDNGKFGYEFYDEQGNPYDLFASISKLGIKNGDKVRCKRIYIGGW